MVNSESTESHESLLLQFEMAGPNSLDDSIGKVVRYGSYLEDMLRECVGILGGLSDDADVLLARQNWEWLYGMAMAFAKNPVYATRRCNYEGLPQIEEALKNADRSWKERSAVVHSAWIICPARLGGSCEIAATNGGEVEEGEFHVVSSVRRKAERKFEHRHVWELEQLVEELEGDRSYLLDSLKLFNPRLFPE
jgi:hypothetical protein